NVALGSTVTLHGGPFFTGGWGGGLVVSPQTVVDGVFLPRGTQWDQGAVWSDENHGIGRAIEVTLPERADVTGMILQADDNDAYRVFAWSAARSEWRLAFYAPPIPTWGMETRPNPLDTSEQYVLRRPVRTDRFLIVGTLFRGDRLFSVSEFQAFGHFIDQSAG